MLCAMRQKVRDGDSDHNWMELNRTKRTKIYVDQECSLSWEEIQGFLILDFEKQIDATFLCCLSKPDDSRFSEQA